MESLNWLVNRGAEHQSCGRSARELVPPELSGAVRQFHGQIPGFRATPLKKLGRLADMLGVGGIWVKDESQRCELTSFKVLGGSYAIYQLLKRRLGESREISFEKLTSAEVRQEFGDLTFAAATDGNHGRGVAWAASKLGQRAVIYVPRGTAPARIDAIRGHGAEVHVIEGTYDDAVELVQSDADRHGWVVVSDTSWEGYEEIPRWVMQGYTTMFSEAQEQLGGVGVSRPTHVFLQAGVGSLAAAAVAFYRTLLGERVPEFVIVEPSKAACLFESVRIGDGRPYKFEGELDTIMAGLSCGKPNPLAWKVLRACARVFVACPDYVAARGMRIYAVPLEGDPFVVSGESGAVTLGVLSLVMQRPELAPLKEALQLNRNAQVLLVNSEGNTDPHHFRKVVWEGAHAMPSSIAISRAVE
ncbi:MAG: diaminopropionate ammonia-lyase [Candidatus Bipolaricaulota bacterium]